MARSDSIPNPEASQKTESGPAFEVWQMRSSTMRLDWSRANAVVLTIAGRGCGEFAPPCVRCWSVAAGRSERLTLFFDFWDMPGYDSAFRVAMTDWMLANRARLEPMHVLARSPIVRMGVSVVNLSLGGLIHTHGMRATYDSALKPFTTRRM